MVVLSKVFIKIFLDFQTRTTNDRNVRTAGVVCSFKRKLSTLIVFVFYLQPSDFAVYLKTDMSLGTLMMT